MHEDEPLKHCKIATAIKKLNNVFELAREHFATTSQENGGPIGPIPYRTQFTVELLDELIESGGTSFLIPTGQQVVMTTGPIPSLGIQKSLLSLHGILCAIFYMEDFRSWHTLRFRMRDIIQVNQRSLPGKKLIVEVINEMIASFYTKRSAAPRPPEFS